MISHMKRTTLLLDNALLAELRRRAANEERTLRFGLTAPATRRPRHTLPSYDLGPFLVDPADARATDLSPRGDRS